MATELNTGDNPMFEAFRLLFMWEDDFSEIKQTLSKNIKFLRHERNLAQERLALDAGVDRTVVSKIERMVSNPSLEILVKLAFVLEVPVGMLLQRVPND